MTNYTQIGDIRCPKLNTIVVVCGNLTSSRWSALHNICIAFFNFVVVLVLNKNRDVLSQNYSSHPEKGHVTNDETMDSVERTGYNLKYNTVYRYILNTFCFINFHHLRHDMEAIYYTTKPSKN